MFIDEGFYVPSNTNYIISEMLPLANLLASLGYFCTMWLCSYKNISII